MRNYKARLICSMLFVIMSCQYGVNFNIENKTPNNIDSLIISNGFNSIKLLDIELNAEKQGFLDFNKENPNLDGSFYIEIFSKESIRKKGFGYYSNGGPSNSCFNIKIEKDTIIIKEIFD
ncbi:hypothetical protein [Aestuariivivens marinum]|uniref:hypothetical protein n=1 Tax=Aestuariivivens marinum TaxID=2913555 RepID=UPI001F595E94|nr:hypothetical protein [Aestuariivivens marinum]